VKPAGSSHESAQCPTKVKKVLAMFVAQDAGSGPATGPDGAPGWGSRSNRRKIYGKPKVFVDKGVSLGQNRQRCGVY
jgi:hypothetical protein